MKKWISFAFALHTLLVLYALFVLFHLSVISGILFFNYVPIDFIWGGKMESREQLLVFELISVIIMMVCLFFTLIKGAYIKIPVLKGVAHYSMWLLFVLFLLNTLGNLAAESLFEKLVFTPITFLLAIFSLRLALGK